MNFTGIIVGLATFLIIGLFHPIVIKAEYYFGTKCWWMFLIAGLIFGAVSILVDNLIVSTILGVTAFSSFWSIASVVGLPKFSSSSKSQEEKDRAAAATRIANL
mgnify:CR=1 FL=1